VRRITTPEQQQKEAAERAAHRASVKKQHH